jgi:NADPH:quinone reductase-like Zn-dependent oxidoreductase
LAHICARRPAPAAPRRCRIVVVRLRGDRIQRRLQVIRSLAGARPIPVVLGPTGGAIGSELLSLLSPGGTLIAYVTDGLGEHLRARVGRRERRGGLRGVTIARWLRGTSPEQRASDIATALELAASRPQEIDVAATYPLAQITDAVREVNRAGKLGTVIVRP